MKKISLALIITSLLFTLLLLGLLVWWQQWQLKETKVVFLNVGQGDAILIQQGRTQILVDSGKDGRQLLSELGRYVPFWDRHIDIIIPTHPDTDHIGGFPALVKNYSVGNILWTGTESDTETFALFQKTFSEALPPERWTKIAKGSELSLPLGGKISVLYPINSFSGRAEDEDTNATSVVLHFVYGQSSFLLTGDLANEERFIEPIPDVTVLKAAHHGSKFSTGNAFLQEVKPEEVVISVGKNNYGHPTKEVLERVFNAGATVLRTDQEGSIEYLCEKEENVCRYVGRRSF